VFIEQHRIKKCPPDQYNFKGVCERKALKRGTLGGKEGFLEEKKDLRKKGEGEGSLVGEEVNTIRIVQR